jgi:hypothetical protein
VTQTVRDRRRLLIAIAVLLAVAEYVDAFFVSFPAGPAGVATLLLLAVFWIRRGGIGGPIAAAALFAFEDANPVLATHWPRRLDHHHRVRRRRPGRTACCACRDQALVQGPQNKDGSGASRSLKLSSPHKLDSSSRDSRTVRRASEEQVTGREYARTPAGLTETSHYPEFAASKDQRLGAWLQWLRSLFVRVSRAPNTAGGFRITKRVRRTGAHGRERPPRIDKLGVTGSSPVPPMKQPCKMG